jgi:hypothetical protein
MDFLLNVVNDFVHSLVGRTEHGLVGKLVPVPKQWGDKMRSSKDRSSQKLTENISKHRSLKKLPHVIFDTIERVTIVCCPSVALMKAPWWCWKLTEITSSVIASVFGNIFCESVPEPSNVFSSITKTHICAKGWGYKLRSTLLTMNTEQLYIYIRNMVMRLWGSALKVKM